MTSTTTGLPDRYRPIDEVGPEETTATGVIRCWRAKDRVLNRDVAIRVHSPGGPAARDWIARALTAGGLATPALAMVYDAAEGSGDPQAPGGAAYVVNEWIEGQTLAERLASGPMSERDARTVLRRLAEGVGEAHRVGLAVGGLTPETVVLRPNGLVGLRAVPAASGTIAGDIAALGALLEYCLTGRRAAAGGPPPAIAQPDLAALVRRARSTAPGAGLSSVAAMVALLGERPRMPSSHPAPLTRGDESDSGWLRRLRDSRPDVAVDPSPTIDATSAAGPRRVDPHALPPVPPARSAGPAEDDLLPLSPGYDGDGYDSDGYDSDGYDSDGYDSDGYANPAADDDGAADQPATTASRVRRTLLVVGLPLLALALVVALAWWLGTNVLSVADSVDEGPGSTPPPSASAPPAEETDAGGVSGATEAQITGAEVYDPFGDGAPENNDDVPLSFDDNPTTAWSTLDYRGSAAFGGLKPGVGVLYDLGSEQSVAGVNLTTTTPGATMEVRAGAAPDGDLDSFAVLASGGIDGSAELGFEEPVTTRYLLVWVTGLVPSDGGFAATVAEVEPQLAG